MKLSTFYGLLTLVLLQSMLMVPYPAQASQFSDITNKKLIEYGWDQFYAPDPTFIRDHIREMEKRPFEGIAFRLPAHQSNIFRVKDWQADTDARNEQLEVLASIKWEKFTDNFLTIYASSDMDWYSDSDWQRVLSKVEYIAKAAKAAGCVGIVFDPEAYGGLPWKYSDQKRISEYSFAQYSDKAHQRGKQFMQAIQAEMPQAKLLMFFQYSQVLWEARSPDAAKREAGLKKSTYGLMIPFLDGMLAEAAPAVTLIDGNENAYYYQTSEDFYKAYWAMKQEAKINVPKELLSRFDQHVRAGSSLYVDQVYGLRSKDTKWRPPVLAWNMTPEQRNKWFEHNVYYALKTSDEYVWLYSERANWFNHPQLPGATGNNKAFRGSELPQGIVEAITSAKDKLKNGELLGYSMDPIYKEVEAKIGKKNNW